MKYRDMLAVFLILCLVRASAQDTGAPAVLFRQAAERESKDMAGAIRLYEDSARRGHTPSMVRLGYLRQSGTGVPRNPAGAFALFSQAAQGGNVDGQFLLAMSYAQGLGTAKDPVAARKWFLQPAAAGYQYAQFALGVMLETGEGGPRKLAAARRWMDRAASGPDATLAAHSAKLRDKVDEKLFAMDTSGTFLVAGGNGAPRGRGRRLALRATGSWLPRRWFAAGAQDSLPP
jgi:Sel1 repeat-containing protein